VQLERPVIELASTRSDVAHYVSTLLLVYMIIIFVYILLNLMFSLGLRTPYSRGTDVVLNFMRDVCEPYLRIFRRIVPTIGMIDFSPWLAIIVLIILQQVIPPLISG
jgi:YggT family protein